jgi:hypothetical protein
MTELRRRVATFRNHSRSCELLHDAVRAGTVACFPHIPVTARKETTMQAERATLADTEKFALPPDLLSELHRRPVRRNDFHVEGWKPSFFGRVMELLGGKSRR